MLGCISRGHITVKAICIVVVLCFFVQDIAWATNGTPLWSVISGNRVLNAQSKDFTNLSKITIPKEYGIIKEIHNTGSNKIIINIQDAHANLGAQESINKVLENLDKNYNLKLVALEGAQGYVDTSFLQSYPDEETRTDIADYFLRRGKLNAPEYYKICSDSKIKLYGVEDPSLYKANVATYIESLKNKGSIHKAVVTFKKVISDLKQKVYSKRLRELDQKRWDYRTDNISFKEYWRYVGKLAHKLRIEIKEYENVDILIKASDLEDRIDFKRAEQERQALIELLTKSLPKKDVEKLLRDSVSFRIGRIQSSAYHNHLREYAVSCGVDISLYPQLSLYTDYINMHDKVILDELFHELDELVWKVQSKLFRDDDEKLLADISRRVDILVDLLDAKTTNKDLSYYKSRKADFVPQKIAHELAKLMAKHDIRANLVPETRAISEALPHVERFYDIAMQRDMALINNTLDKMDKDNRSLAVLVTGGFHTEGITSILRNRGISYMVLLPKFSKDALERPYDDIILNKKEPFEEILSRGEYYLAAANALSNFRQPVDMLSFIARFEAFGSASMVAEGGSMGSVQRKQRLWESAAVDTRRKVIREGEIPADITQEQIGNAINGWSEFFVPATPKYTVPDGVVQVCGVFNGNTIYMNVNVIDRAADLKFRVVDVVEAEDMPERKPAGEPSVLEEEVVEQLRRGKDELIDKPDRLKQFLDTLFERRIDELLEARESNPGRFRALCNRWRQDYRDDSGRLDRIFYVELDAISRLIGQDAESATRLAELRENYTQEGYQQRVDAVSRFAETWQETRKNSDQLRETIFKLLKKATGHYINNSLQLPLVLEPEHIEDEGLVESARKSLEEIEFALDSVFERWPKVMINIETGQAEVMWLGPNTGYPKYAYVYVDMPRPTLEQNLWQSIIDDYRNRHIEFKPQMEKALSHLEAASSTDDAEAIAGHCEQIRTIARKIKGFADRATASKATESVLLRLSIASSPDALRTSITKAQEVVSSGELAESESAELVFAIETARSRLSSLIRKGIDSRLGLIDEALALYVRQAALFPENPPHGLPAVDAGRTFSDLRELLEDSGAFLSQADQEELSHLVAKSETRVAAALLPTPASPAEEGPRASSAGTVQQLYEAAVENGEHFLGFHGDGRIVRYVDMDAQELIKLEERRLGEQLV
ncbi:MAG: hypothetical protein HQ572_01300, partial [Candidatus Omnitrophica bacterium]|nr:hypothetical protein [Candidatus Omnitrophota bacterium]